MTALTCDCVNGTHRGGMGTLPASEIRTNIEKSAVSLIDTKHENNVLRISRFCTQNIFYQRKKKTEKPKNKQN